MGQKVNPVGMRIGLNKNWNSRWFAEDKDYSRFLVEDIKIREFLEAKIGKDSQLSHVEIERKKNDKGYFVRVIVCVAKPGTVIGQKGENINKLTDALVKMLHCSVKIDVVEIKQPYLDARIVADQICAQLEARASFRIVQKKAIAQVRKAGAKGCKTEVSGRLAGADIARSEGYKEGTMAINTLTSDIDYSCREAMTTYGKLGVKVWICRGEKEINSKLSEPETNSRKKGE